MEAYESDEQVERISDFMEIPEIFESETYEGLRNKFPELEMENWEKLSHEERLTATRELEDKLAELQGRDACTINTTTLAPFHFGYYDPCSREITLNQNLLENPEYLGEMVDTVAHEGIHALQDYVGRHPGEFTGIPDATKITWILNENQYFDSETFGMEIYSAQPLEEWARMGATNIKSAIFG